MTLPKYRVYFNEIAQSIGCILMKLHEVYGVFS